MNAYAQTLAPATAASTDWWLIAAIVIIAAAVAAFVWYKRKNPAGAATLTADAGADLKKIGADVVTELGKLRSSVEAHLAASGVPAAAAPPAPAAPPPPAGKVGVAGVLSLPVTGDPKADMAAFQAAYFG